MSTTQQLAKARSWPTDYQVAVALMDVAERVHRDDPPRARRLTTEAIARVRVIQPPVSQAYALRTMLNYARTTSDEIRRIVLSELAALQCDYPEPLIAEALTASLVVLRQDKAFVDQLAANITPEPRRDIALKALQVARDHDRAKLPPLQARSKQERYDCKTLGATCTHIYRATKGRGRRWQHDWTFQWCKSIDLCGVKTTNTPCEFVSTVPGQKASNSPTHGGKEN